MNSQKRSGDSFLKTTDTVIKAAEKAVSDEIGEIQSDIKKERKKIKVITRVVGPGVVTGASDDDPSGIGTYSVAGAQYGLGLNWLTLFAFPMMIALQEISARVGVVTGHGLAGVLKRHFHRYLLYGIVSLLIIANVVNIGADIGAMAASAKLITPLSFPILAIFFAVLIIFLELFISYRNYAKVLKWLTLSLISYLFTALIVTDSWRDVAVSLVNVNIQFDKNYLLMIVGFFGTTISPYLYFWQTSEEVEENTVEHKFAKKTSPKQLRIMRMDVLLGTFMSQAAAFFIILTTALTLHNNGIFNIEDAASAASALKPLAGEFAFLLFAVGIIGTGLLGIPVLAGSSAYAVSECLNWKEGLSYKFKQAKGFYIVIALSTIIGLLINFLGINPIKALVWAAVVNGVAAVPLIAMMMIIGSDSKIMGKYINKFWSNLFGWLAFAVMGMAVILMFWGFLK